ncbi:MAG: radical SAM protein [Phycisphaerales bacterium]
MAIFTLTDAYIAVNGVVLSDHSNSVTVEDTRDSVDITAFGASSKAMTKGLGDAKITVDFFQDFASGKVHATLQPLIGSTTGVTIEVRATSSARSATNPAALMTGLLMNYNMLAGGIGEASTITAEFVNSANAGMTYLTS